MTWVQTVVAAHSESEAPAKFFYWAALSAISAVVKKNIYLERYYYKLYPNTYVFLVATSGMKKSIPITMAKSLVAKANCARIVSGRNSMQRIIQDLGKAVTLEEGGMVKNAQGFLISGELASFLVRDQDALTILTDIHDTHSYEKEWINSLKGTGVDKLKEPCITLLGATNEEHFSDAVPSNAIGGGFIARTFIVYAAERSNLNSLTRAPKTVVDTGRMAKYLAELSQLRGEMRWTAKAMDLYDEWYYAFMAEERTDPTGTFNRIGDQALKAAMLISLSESPELVLEDRHVWEGIEQTTSCITGMQQITMGSGQQVYAKQTKLVLRELLVAPNNQIQRNRLLQKHWGELDAFDLDRIMQTLADTGHVDIVHQGKSTTYVLLKSGVEMYTKFFNHLKKDIH